MSELLFSSRAPFTMEVPYQLFHSGSIKEKPLIVYLHGYKQNGMLFKKKVQPLFAIDAYHLVLQGPYPVYDESRSRKVEQWGRAWYLYDGGQQQFLSSMEKSSVFIEKTIEKVSTQIKVSRLGIVGYSMGGYLAGYLSLSRPGLVNEMVVMGGRIKVEHFLDHSYNGLHVLALHGLGDASVVAHTQQKSCAKLKQLGAEVTYKTLDQGHRLTDVYIREVKDWMLARGYSSTTLMD